MLNGEEEDEQVYTLKVKGKKNYEMLRKLNEALEIQDLYSKIKRTNSNSNAKLIKGISFQSKTNELEKILKRKLSNETITNLEQ